VWTVTVSATKLKNGNCRPKQREQLRTLNASQTNNIMRDSMHAVFGPPLPVLSIVTDHAHQYFYVSILWSSTSSLFSSEFGNNCLERNTTEQITMCNCKIRTKSLTLCQFRTRKVISEKISTLMDRNLPNKRTKFSAKIFRSY